MVGITTNTPMLEKECGSNVINEFHFRDHGGGKAFPSQTSRTHCGHVSRTHSEPLYSQDHESQWLANPEAEQTSINTHAIERLTPCGPLPQDASPAPCDATALELLQIV